MISSSDLKRRALELSSKTNSETIAPTEVGGLAYDTLEYIEDVERNGGSLGIRKTYATVSAMEADSNPVDDKNGSPLRRGMLVNIYNQDDPSAPDNGKVFSWQNPGWQLRAKLDAGYATTEQVDAIKTEQDEKLSELDEKVDNIKPVVINGDVTNNADNEDLEAVIDPDSSKGVMKFKDRPYNPSAFSGKGYAILRKNVSAKSRSGSANILTQDMINQPNTTYEVRYDFDLGGEEIIVPEGCTLKFRGGSFNNGRLSGSALIDSDKEVIFKNISIDKLNIEGDCYSDWFYGVEDDNLLLNSIINSGAKYIQLKKTVYNISHKILLDEKYSPLIVKAGAGIIIDKCKSNINFNGAIFKQTPNNDSRFAIVYVVNSSNVDIDKLTIIGDKKEHLVNTGQWSAGVCIAHDCKNIKVINCYISECYGDCICIDNNSPEENYERAENISIINNYLGNCLRNNVSCIGAKNVLIQNNVMTRIDSAPGSTDCTAQLFIDVESNYSFQDQDEIQILNNYCYCNKLGIHDCSGGISVRGISHNNDIIIADNKLFNCWYYGINVGSLDIDANIQVFNNYIDNVKQDSIIIDKNISPYMFNNTVNRAGIGKYNEKTKINNSSFTNIKEGTIVNQGIFIGCDFKNSVISNKILFENSELYDCRFINIKNENIDTLDLGYCIALNNSILSNVKFVNCSGYCVLNQYGGDTNFSSIKFYNCRNKVATYYNTTAKNININDIEFVNCERYNILCLKNDDTERRIFINHVVIKDSVEDTTKQTRYLSICDGQTLSIENFVVSDVNISPSNYYKGINSGDYVVIGKGAKCHNISVSNASDTHKVNFYNTFNENEADEIYFNGEKIIGTSLTLSSLSDKLFAKNILTNKFYKEGNRTPKVPIWNISEDGVTPKWIDALGNPPDAQRAGTFSQKPSNIAYGFSFYCTDKKTAEGNRDGIMIYYAGNETWVDALGRVVE